MGNYLRGVTRTFGPSRLIVCVPHCIETNPTGAADRALVHCTHVYATFNRRVKDRWRGEYHPERIDVLEWWKWVESKSHKNCKLWIIAPCGSDLMTLTGGFKHIEEGRYSLIIPGDDAEKASCNMRADKPVWHGRLSLSGKTDIIQFLTPKGTICVLSRTNYLDAPLAQLADSVSLPLLPSEPGQSSTIVGQYTSASACAVLSQYLKRTISEWISADCGTWRETVAGLSVSYFRRRTGGGGLLRHSVPEAHSIEDAACHGGRASTWFYGDIGVRGTCRADPETLPAPSDYPTLLGRANLWDVSSMYPTLLRDMQFPVRLGGVWPDIDPRDIPQVQEHWGLIATVTLDTAIAEYPYRGKDGTYYPVGRFVTTLCGPELTRAALEGSIKKVWRVARYEMGNPFAPWIEELLLRRKQHATSGDKARELFYKSLANSFGGKFAQSGAIWVPRWDWIPDMAWGAYIRYDADTGAYSRCRSIAGTVCERVATGRGGMLPTAVYCYLTSYGRDAMRRYRELVGPCAAISQDTDGVWLTDEASCAMAERAGTVSGYSTWMVHRRMGRFARFFDARHYCVDGVWTLAGVCNGFTLSDRDTVHEPQLNNLARLGARCESPVLEKRTRIKRICTTKPKCRITPSGWALPIEIGEVAPNGTAELLPKWLYR